MDKISKPEFVKQLESLLNQTGECENIRLRYGYLEDDGIGKINFIESDVDLTKQDDPREIVAIYFEGAPYEHYISVNMDSLYAVLLDVIDKIKQIR